MLNNKLYSLHTCIGPTRTTKADFIQMIWDHKSPVIVMLTRLTENGKVCLYTIYAL